MNTKTKILKVNEYYELNNTQKLNEMATINSPKDSSLPFNKYTVSVYSDDHTPAHFHYQCLDRKIELKIDILTLNIIHSTPRIGVPKNALLSWTGLTSEKKYLRNWIKSKYSKNPNMTNYDAIIFTWNVFHSEIELIDINTKCPW